MSSNISTYAHEILLNIEYDDCEVTLDRGTPVNEGENEIWYYLISRQDLALEYNGECLIYIDYTRHLDHETTTIRYYFADSAKDDNTYKWTTDIYEEYRKIMSEEEAQAEAERTAEQIKYRYAQSMKKWNNIYYYSYDEDGNRIKNKLINVVEGTETNSNLIIYPIDY